MYEYTDIRTTPLKFHKFYWKIWMPIQVILGGWNFGTLSVNLQSMDVYTRVDMAHYLLSGVLIAGAMGGFFRWKRSALIYVFAQMAENLVYVAAMYIAAAASGGDTGFALSAVIGTLIRCIPVSIYYYKRRKLFVKGGYTKEQMENINRGMDNSFAGSFRNSGYPNSTYNSSNSNYGSSYNPYGSSYNPYAAPQNTEEPAAHPTDSQGLHRVCPFCGKDVTDSSNFCIYCGEKLK